MIQNNKNLLYGMLLASFLVALTYYLMANDFDRTSKIVAISIISICSLALYIFIEWKKKRDIKNDIPIDDELTIKSKIYAGSKAFQISMLLWLAIFIFHESFTEPETMLGTGILGSALIYGLCLLYFKSTQNFDNSNL